MQNKPHESPTGDYLAPGPFSIPGRDWILVAFLVGMLAIKMLAGLGTDSRVWTLLGLAVFLLIAIPPMAAWLCWRLRGKRPFWGEIGFIVTAGVIFVGISLPVYLTLAH